MPRDSFDLEHVTFKKKLLSSIFKNCCYIPFLLIFKLTPVIAYRKKSGGFIPMFSVIHLKMQACIDLLQ